LLRLSLGLIAAGWLLLASSVQAAGPEVIVLPTTGIVDDSMAKYLADNIAGAEQRGAAAVVVKLNTPGGALTSTNDIVGTFLESKVPIIVWVAPAGGFAASAGTFITLASNIALMAPGTRIGAASPINGDGSDIGGTLGTKIMNDAIAEITSIAQERGRNVDWAVSAVRDAKSSPVEEAVSLGVVNGTATTIDEVIGFANGKTVKTAVGDVTLDLTGATLTEQTMNPLLSFIRLLSDPTIVALLFSTGSIGLLAELYSPNFVTGILGTLMILLALIGLGTLPLNVGGLLLILFGLVLFGLELTVTSHGLLGFGGVVCLALGASALFTGPIDPFGPAARVATPVIVTVVVTAAALMGLVVWAALGSRRLRPAVMAGNASVPPGSTGVVRRPLGPNGSVYAGGEEWSARSADNNPIERGVSVKVLARDGLTLVVEPDAASSSQS